MADWQHLIQSVFIGLLFSYLLAKLISVVVSFKDENLTIARHVDDNHIIYDAKNQIDASSDDFGGGTHDLDSLIGEHGSVRNESLPGSDIEGDKDDDDWEDVETTELDELFSAATAFVATAAADRLSHKLPNDVQLLLYGWYKIATEGPCSSSQPSALKMTARAKWQAWQKLGAMPPEDAMQKYIDTVTELYPAWLSGSSMEKKAGDTGASSRESKEPMGPVFSSFVYEEEGENELKMDAIHGFAREGQVNNLLKCIEDGVSVDLKDSEGRTPLHWAVDRGHLSIVEKLVGKNADVNAKDCEGQTALHYAAVCEREVIADFLVKHNAKIDVKDDNGDSPRDICDLKWPFMDVAAQQMQE